MKKLLCAVLVLSALAIGGCSEKKPDIEELFTNVAKNQKEIKALSADMDMVMKMNMSDDTQETKIPINMDMAGDIIVDKKGSMYTKMEAEVNTMGVNEKNTAEVYQVEENNELVQYSTEDGTSWVKTTLGEIEDPMENLTGGVEMYEDIAENPDSVKYVGKTKINKKDAYEFTIKVDADDLKEMTEAVGQDESVSSLINMFFGEDFKMEITMFIYEKEETLAKIAIDFKDSFDEMLNKFLSMSEETQNMNMNVDVFTIELAFAYDDVKTVNIPAEVKNTASENSYLEVE